MKCKKCGTKNPADSRFCECCGSPLENISREKMENANNKWKLIITIGVTLLVGMILGGSLMWLKNSGKNDDHPIETSFQNLQILDEESTTSQKESTPTPTVIVTPENIVTDTETVESVEVTPYPEVVNPTRKPKVDAYNVEDLETEIEKIREIYYGVTMHNENFNIYPSTDKITVYESKTDGHIQCICVDRGAYTDLDFPLTETYAAEYYYSYLDGMYQIRFVFVHNADYSEEYRIYFNKDQVNFRRKEIVELHMEIGYDKR